MRWVLSDRVEQTSEIDETFSVELQCLYRGTTDRRTTDDQGEVVAPNEMISPVLSSGVEERHFSSGDRIEGLCLGVFVAVATLAGKSKIVERISTALGQGMDVLDREGLHGEACGRSAVFT
jgi:hypothetical protein